MKISATNIYLLIFTLILTSYDCRKNTKSLPKKTKLNFILFFAKSDINDESDESVLVKGLNFTSESVIAPCLPKTEENFPRNQNDTNSIQDSNPTCNCEYLLKTSLLSLITWAQNIIGMSTATIHLDKISFKRSNKKRYSIKNKRRYQRSPQFYLNILTPNKNSFSSESADIDTKGEIKAKKLNPPFFNTLSPKHKYRYINDIASKQENSLFETESYDRVVSAKREVVLSDIGRYYDENIDSNAENTKNKIYDVFTEKDGFYDFAVEERSGDPGEDKTSKEDEDELSKENQVVLKHDVDEDNLFCPKYKPIEDQHLNKLVGQVHEVSEDQNMLKIERDHKKDDFGEDKSKASDGQDKNGAYAYDLRIDQLLNNNKENDDKQLTEGITEEQDLISNIFSKSEDEQESSIALDLLNQIENIKQEVKVKEDGRLNKKKDVADSLEPEVASKLCRKEKYKKAKHNRNFVLKINDSNSDFEQPTTPVFEDEDYGEKCKLEKITESIPLEYSSTKGEKKVQMGTAATPYYLNKGSNSEEIDTGDEFLMSGKNDGKVEDVFQVFNIMSSMKESFLKAFLDPLWGNSGEKHSPSLFNIVKQMMEELQGLKHSKGYIAVINAGRLSELKREESELMKTIKYLNCKRGDDTVLILTGDCPKSNSSFLPLYVNGLSNEKFNTIQQLDEIPQKIKKIIEHKYALM